MSLIRKALPVSALAAAAAAAALTGCGTQAAHTSAAKPAAVPYALPGCGEAVPAARSFEPVPGNANTKVLDNLESALQNSGDTAVAALVNTVGKDYNVLVHDSNNWAGGQPGENVQIADSAAVSQDMKAILKACGTR